MVVLFSPSALKSFEVAGFSRGGGGGGPGRPLMGRLRLECQRLKNSSYIVFSFDSVL